MNGKNIAVAGIAGGTLLFILLFGVDAIMNRIIAYNNDLQWYAACG